MAIPCDSASLIDAAKCVQCIPPGMQFQVLVNLLCTIVNAGGSVPAGGIIMWSGTIATVPAGWHLCDGTSGTPDLRNRFVVCANADSGGVAKTTLTGGATQTGGSISHQHTLEATFNEIAADLETVNLNPGILAHNYYDENTANAIGPQPTDVTAAPQPYFALAYIQKL